MVRMSVPASRSAVAKLWRSVWQPARLSMCAARAAAVTAFCTALSSAARRKLGAMALGHAVDLGPERVTRGRGEEGRTVVVALAATDHDLAAVEVDVLHAEA